MSRVVLPAPVGPTTAIRSPGSTDRDTLRSWSSAAPAYRNDTSSISIRPLRSPGATVPVSRPWGCSSITEKTRSAEARPDCTELHTEDRPVIGPQNRATHWRKRNHVGRARLPSATLGPPTATTATVAQPVRATSAGKIPLKSLFTASVARYHMPCSSSNSRSAGACAPNDRITSAPAVISRT